MFISMLKQIHFSPFSRCNICLIFRFNPYNYLRDFTKYYKCKAWWSWRKCKEIIKVIRVHYLRTSKVWVLSKMKGNGHYSTMLTCKKSQCCLSTLTFFSIAFRNVFNLHSNACSCLYFLFNLWLRQYQMVSITAKWTGHCGINR